MADSDFNFWAASNAAPTLSQSPSLLVGASSDPVDPAGAAQTVGGVVEYNASQEALKHLTEHKSGFLGHVFGLAGDVAHGLGEIPGAKSAASGIASALNKPEKFIQHEYRYGHDVAARHGWSAFYTGKYFYQTPSQGEFADSWERTRIGAEIDPLTGKLDNGYVDPNSHRQVSFGRDVTSLVPWLSDETTTRHSIVSGLLDAVFDLGTDPTLKVGKAAQAAKALDLTREGSIAAAGVDDLSAVQKLRVKMASSITMKNADSWDIAMQNPRVAAAARKIAATNSPSEMRRLLPRATDDEIRTMVAAKTVEDVKQAHMDALHTSNILNKAPVVSLMSPVSTRLRTIGVKDAAASRQLGQDIADGTEDVTQATARRERLQRRFLTKTPLDVDPENLHPTKSFHLDGPNAGDIVHAITKYSFDHKVADAVRDAFLDTTDMTKRAVIYGNAVKAAAWNMGFKDLDPTFWNKFSADLDTNGLRIKRYGISSEDGSLLDGAIKTPDRAGGDGSTAAAIFSAQTGRMPIIGFNDMKLAIADAQKFKQADGAVRKTLSVLNPTKDSGFKFKADDFLYKHLTQPVFKRLALFSGGFALRIGLGEGLYRSLDDGVIPYLRSQVNTAATRLGYKIDRGTRDNLISSGLYAGLHKMSGEEAQIGVRLQLQHDGHLLPHELDANHVAQDTLESKRDDYFHNYKKVELNSGRPTNIKNVFKKYSEEDEHYNYFYRKHLQDIADSPEARVLAGRYLTALKAGHSDADVVVDHARFLQSEGGRAATRHMDRASDKALADNGHYPGMAGAQLNALKGAVTGQNGVVNVDALKAIAEGSTPTLSDLEKLDGKFKPGSVPGLDTEGNMAATVERFFNAGHVKVISPVINGLSRNGAFIRHVNEQYKLALRSGMGDEDAFRIAQQRAAHRLMPDIHNPNIRTQFSEMARNYMPFYFAQDQAYRRWARLAVRSPESLRKLQLAHQGAVNTGFIHKDPTTGNETFMYPMSGYIGSTLTPILQFLHIPTVSGVPLSFSGNVSSLSTVTPFAETPGLHAGGPVVGIPIKALEMFSPEASGFAQEVEGPKGSGSSALDMILPNAAIKNVLTAYGAENSRAFQSAQMQALQSVYFDKLNSLSPDEKAAFLSDPFAQQKLLEQTKNYTRAIFLLKAVVGEGLPTQPSMHIGDSGIRDELAKYMKSEPTMTEAIAKLQAAHPNMDISPYTVFQSQTKAGGYVPPTQEALDFFDTHKQFLTKLPYGGSFLIPQKGADADALKIYNEQIASGLRAKREPKEFLQQLYVNAGNSQYYKLKDQRDAALAAVGDTNPDLKAQINTAWSGVSAALSQQNPVWASQQGSKVNAVNRERALQDFAVLFDPANAAKVPQGRQTELVGSLYRQYQQYHGQRALMVQQPGTGLSADIKALDDQWQAYLTAQAKKIPELQPVIQSVFQEVK